jgi:nucleoid DNA-binding protein
MLIKEDKIIAELSEKYGLPKYMVEEIVKSQFKFLISAMEEGKHKGMRLHNLGVFMVKPARVEHLERLWEKLRLEREKDERPNSDI